MAEQWLLHFISTCIIEGIIILFLLRSKSIVLGAVLLNLGTHPITWTLHNYSLNLHTNHLVLLLWLEIGIAVTEGMILALLSKQRWVQILLAVIIANYCSFLIGMLLFY